MQKKIPAQQPGDLNPRQCAVQKVIMLNNLKLLVRIFIYMYIYNAKQKHLGCKKGEANQKQQLSDYKSIHSYTCD